MTFEELIKLAEPYMMSETLEGVGQAKIMIDEYRDAHLEELTPEQRNILTRANISLMRDISDLVSHLPEIPGFPDEDEDDGIPALVIPADKGSIPYWRNP